ncbi:MAG: hypothetical protein PWQ67_1508 [Clostridia bacterium]|nr:hypothetical protein [Clostridia bacterium]MDN5323054.1 hypothetical protein [Clostridia bacterium]
MVDVGLEKIIEELFTYHRGKTIGVLIGLIFSILVITVGLLETVFITICIYIGFIIGKRLDENESFNDLVQKLFKDKK